MRISIPKPRSKALAIAAAATVAAAVPSQGRADVCADYRAAVALHEAATAAYFDHPPDPFGNSPDAVEWRESQRARNRAMHNARAARGRAARAVHGAIEDEAARTAIDALLESSIAVNAALNRLAEWPGWTEINSRQYRSFTAVSRASRSISEAYGEALLAACALGLARAGE